MLNTLIGNEMKFVVNVKFKLNINIEFEKKSPYLAVFENKEFRILISFLQLMVISLKKF